MKRLGFSSLIFFMISMIIVLYTQKITHWILLLVAIYLYTAFSNECRSIENIWIFTLVAVSSIPLNIYVVIKACSYMWILADGIIGKILLSVLIYIILFSVEEIITGIIGRLIFVEQMSF